MLTKYTLKRLLKMVKKDIGKTLGYKYLPKHLDKLSPREKDVISMYYFQNYTLEQISQIFNVCFPRAKQILDSGRTKLKRCQVLDDKKTKLIRLKLMILEIYTLDPFFQKFKNELDKWIDISFVENPQLVEIEYLGLLYPTKNALIRNDINNVKELLTAIVSESITMMPNIGLKRVNEIYTKLREKGFLIEYDSYS